MPDPKTRHPPDMHPAHTWSTSAPPRAAPAAVSWTPGLTKEVPGLRESPAPTSYLTLHALLLSTSTTPAPTTTPPHLSTFAPGSDRLCRKPIGEGDLSSGSRRSQEWLLALSGDSAGARRCRRSLAPGANLSMDLESLLASPGSLMSRRSEAEEALNRLPWSCSSSSSSCSSSPVT